MTPREKIYEMLCIANSDDRKFPATIFYNEGWLLRLVLDWFSRQGVAGYALDFKSGARWFPRRCFLPNFCLATAVIISRRAGPTQMGS